MAFYIYKNDRQFGPFEENEILSWLKNGQLSPADLVRREEIGGWQPLDGYFSNPETLPKSIVSLSPPTSGADDFHNQPVVDWAQKNLSTPVKIELLYNSIFARIVLFSVLFAPPVLCWGLSIYSVYFDRQSEGPKAPLINTALVTAPFLLIGFIIWFIRKNFVKTLDAEGLITRRRKRHRWKDLYFIDTRFSYSRNWGRVPSRTVLVFKTGKAVIPPQIDNSIEVLALIKSIPAERREDGQVLKN